jgi:hypothetical protein
MSSNIHDKDIDVDVQTVEVTSVDNESVEMEVKAKEVATLLCKTYPDHPWMVGWAPGMALVVKHMAGDSRYGFTIDARTVTTPKQLAHMAMLAGGELLERMGMSRGRWNGDMGEQYQLA